ncbi:MAG: prepilin peptidase [Lachnospiraceae bacterium]|nr:prepilin peptidase [Lachnospiraceae bacterium]
MNGIDRYGFLIPYSVIASYFDIKSHKIPNEVTLFGVISCGMYRLLFLRQSLGDMIINTLIAIAILIMYALNQLGGGDIKLISTIIILMKWEETANWLMLSVLAQAGLFAVTHRKRLPFAPALSIGLIITGLGI